MGKGMRSEPTLSEATRAAQEDRQARLAEAMRANLKKRKAQGRGRAETRAAPTPQADD